MSEKHFNKIKDRSIKGILALTSRTLVLQGVAFAGVFLLTLLLSPEEYGVFAVVSALVNFFTYFSDVGLAAALIQKKKKLTDKDLNTTFWIQQGLVFSLFLIALAISSWVGNWYNLGQPGVWLYRALAFSLVLSSLKTIPSIILERKLLFDRLVAPQVLETLGFYVVAVVLASLGFGVSSFTWAVLARGVLGLVSLYILAPWHPEPIFSWRVARKLFSFGLPFQLNSFLALVKDDLLMAYLGKILPFSQVGYIGWAKKWAYFPYRLVSDNLIRVTFPVYSRLQKFPEKLKAAVEKSIFGTSLFLFPVAGGLIVLSQQLIDVIPKYEKWQPALPSLKIFAITAAISGLSTPLINALNSVGKIKITLRFMVLWTVLTWAFTPILANQIGFVGVALAALLVGLSSLLVLPKASKILTLRLFNDLAKNLLATLGMVLFLFLSTFVLPEAKFVVVLQVILGALVYFGLVWTLSKKRILSVVNMIKSVFVS